jgi:vancomycin resistance protein VanJ
MTRWLRRITVWAACAYPLGLAVTALLFRWVGERWWVTGVAMYLPRLLLAIPLGVLVPLLLALQLRRWLWTQLIASLLLLFPLMGFVMPSPRANTVGPTLRVMSYNVHECLGGFDALAARIQQYSPDVVLLQETCNHSEPFIERLRRTHRLVRVDGQFLLASRFPLSARPERDPLRRANPEYMYNSIRYELATPLGSIAFYSVHPISPRRALYAVGAIGIRSSIRAGNLLHGGSAQFVARQNYEARELQLTAAAARAMTDPAPVVVCGDTNSPGLSPMLERLFGDYQDGFDRAGWGFGYTFPSRYPWMRIDRIFAGRKLRFTNFLTGCGRESDHRCVVAELTLEPH